MRRISGIFITVVLLVGLGLSGASAQTEELTYTQTEARLADTPSKYGFKGLYMLYSPDTYQKGKFGIGVYWDMTRFCLPGDPRYPELQEFTLGAAYGITDRLEVAVAAPFRSLTIPERESEYRFPDDDAFNEVSESGFSNVSVGLRFSLFPGASFEMTPYVQAFLPTASDPEAGTGADNTRIHFGMSAGTVLEELGNTRLYTQAAYQFATDYDQDRRDFTEAIPGSQPRFERFGTNPLFHEYGNTLFYGAGLAFPLVPDTAELFSELLFYHSFEDEDYIPMFEDGEALDVVQDGGMAHVGAQFGFGNGFAVKAGWGGILFAEEPMYESPTWRVFAGLTYNRPETIVVEAPPGVEEAKPPTEVGEAEPPQERKIEVGPARATFDCTQELAMVHFEFDKSTLTPEGIATLQRIGKIMRLCDNLVLEVQGHTDWVGTENYNYGLGNRRARAVVYYLVYDEGIDPARIVNPDKLAKGIIAGESYGESVPIATNETDAGRALNRRAQFVKLVEDNRILGQ
jgi:outer membrane protein OmpA-like peptidoglycan-associated protein